jgi:hypothetical protein
MHGADRAGFVSWRKSLTGVACSCWSIGIGLAPEFRAAVMVRRPSGSALVILAGQPAVTTSTIRGYRDGATYTPALGRRQHLAFAVRC